LEGRDGEKILKVSILTAIWNKEDQLRNYLFGLGKQETDFEYEVCFVDDHSDTDPYKIIKEFCINEEVTYKYKRLDKHSAFNKTQGIGMDLIAEESDIIVLIGADIILTRSDDLQKLVEKVEDKKFTLAEVVDIPIDEDFYKSYDENVKWILDDWESHIHQLELPIDKRVYERQWTIYTGKNWTSWLLFCGAIKKKDLIDIGFIENSCDAVVKHKMKEQGLQAILVPEVKAIHQRHLKKVYDCPDIESCSYHCIRKLK